MNRLLNITSFITSLFQKKTCFYFGANIDNLGDRVLLDFYKKALPLNIYWYPGNDKTKLRILFFLTKYCKIRPKIIIGGGTIIFTPLITQYLKNIAKWGLTEKMLFYIFGSGVKDIAYWNKIDANYIDIPSWEALLKNNKFYVRGNRSKSTLLSITEKINIDISLDPAVYFYNEFMPVKKYEGIMIVNFGITGNRVLNISENELLEKVYKVCQRLLSENVVKKLIVCSVCDNDDQINKKYYALLTQKFPGKVKIEKEHNDMESFSKIMTQASISLGIKMHFTLLAMCCKVPSLNIAYQPKCYDLFEAMKLNDYVLDTDATYYDKVKGLIDDFDTHFKNTEKRLAASKKHLEDKLTTFKQETGLN